MSVDYGLTPELGNNYETFITYVTDQYKIGRGYKYKHSEFKDPNAEDYETMDVQWDWPWDEKPPWSDDPDVPDIWLPGAGAPTFGGGGDTTVSRCNCLKLGIGGTTGQVAVGQTQSLVVTGLNTSLCDPENITWSVSGGGSLAGFSSAGFNKTFIAPDSNANCDNNTSVCVSCDDETVCTQIASNAWTSSTDIAFIKYKDVCDGCVGPSVAWPSCPKSTTLPSRPFQYGSCCSENFRCDGNFIAAGLALYMWNTACSPSPEAWCAEWTCADSGLVEGTKDVRTVAMKAGGCCPKELF